MCVLNLSLRPGLPPDLQPHRLSSIHDSQLLLRTEKKQVEITLTLICFIDVEDVTHKLRSAPDSLSDD
jgi:hypothetical protein